MCTLFDPTSIAASRSDSRVPGCIVVRRVLAGAIVVIKSPRDATRSM